MPTAQQVLPHACSFAWHCFVQAPFTHAWPLPQHSPLQQGPSAIPQTVPPHVTPAWQRPLEQTSPPAQHWSPQSAVWQQTPAPELVRWHDWPSPQHAPSQALAAGQHVASATLLAGSGPGMQTSPGLQASAMPQHVDPATWQAWTVSSPQATG